MAKLGNLKDITGSGLMDFGIRGLLTLASSEEVRPEF